MYKRRHYIRRAYKGSKRLRVLKYVLRRRYKYKRSFKLRRLMQRFSPINVKKRRYKKRMLRIKRYIRQSRKSIDIKILKLFYNGVNKRKNLRMKKQEDHHKKNLVKKHSMYRGKHIKYYRYKRKPLACKKYSRFIGKMLYRKMHTQRFFKFRFRVRRKRRTHIIKRILSKIKKREKYYQPLCYP